MRPAFTLVAVLSTAVLFAGMAPGGEEPELQFKERAAVAAIVELSYRLDAPDVSDRAKLIVREHESESISSIFSPTKRGGFGAGKLLGDNPNPSIQQLVMRWRSRPPTKEHLEANRADALQVARVIRAMSELAPHRKPRNPNPSNVKQWSEVAVEFKAAAIDFHQAVKGDEPETVKLAAKRLHVTCCHCHTLVE